MTSISGAYRSIGSDLKRIYGRGLQDFSDQVNSTIKPIEDAAGNVVDYITSPIRHVYEYTRDDLKELSREYNTAKDNVMFGLEVTTAIVAVGGALLLIYVGKKLI